MIVVDTSVWIDYFNGVVNPETEALDGLLASDIIVSGRCSIERNHTW